MRGLRDRLRDILAAIGNIEEEVANGRTSFDADPKNQVWIIHHLRIIGEAVRTCSDQVKELSPDTPWAQIVRMRHILVHDYFGIDLDEVWNAATKDLPPLKQIVDGLLETIEEAL